MSATTAFQPVAAHQLRGGLNSVPQVVQKTENASNLSGSVRADLSFFVPPEDGSAVSLYFKYTFRTSD